MFLVGDDRPRYCTVWVGKLKYLFNFIFKFNVFAKDGRSPYSVTVCHVLKRGTAEYQSRKCRKSDFL